MKLLALTALLALSVSGLRLQKEDAAKKDDAKKTDGKKKNETGPYKPADHTFRDLPDINGGFQAWQHFQFKSRQDGNLVMFITDAPIDDDVFRPRMKAFNGPLDIAATHTEQFPVHI